jgi:predicted DNA-binding mobile mystery protein A
MASDFRQLKLRQLDQQLQGWRKTAKATPRPREGWLRTLRMALGLSTGQLAERLGARQPRVLQLEKGEISDTATLASLRKAADALDCDLVYALVPRKPLEQMVRDQVDTVAKQELATVSHSMALEEQRPSYAVETRQLKELRASLLAGPWRRLWR